MAAHKTKNATVKKARIDVGILPVINWLNSHDFIITMYCCEGRGPEDPEWDHENKGNINSVYKPYITFLTYCYIDPIKYKKGDRIQNSECLYIIQKLLEYGNFDEGIVKNESDSKDGRFKYYCYRFRDKESLRNFIKNEL